MTLLSSSLAGGFLATLVLTTITHAASELRLTRMDLPFLLGTMVTENRRKAKAIGYLLHFAIGLAFALAYAAFFSLVGRSTWGLGALLGALHALFMSMVLVNVLLPAVHPRIGTPDSAADEVALIEPPGFLMLNYGTNTFVVMLAAHVAYGAIVGAMIRI